jgi:hypothetical protein
MINNPYASHLGTLAALGSITGSGLDMPSSPPDRRQKGDAQRHLQNLASFLLLLLARLHALLQVVYGDFEPAFGSRAKPTDRLSRTSGRHEPGDGDGDHAACRCGPSCSANLIRVGLGLHSFSAAEYGSSELSVVSRPPANDPFDLCFWWLVAIITLLSSFRVSVSFFVHTAETNLRGTKLAPTFYVPTRLSQILQPPLSMSTAPASVYGA